MKVLLKHNNTVIIIECSPANYKRWHGNNCRNKIKDNNENIDRMQ
jgi:hypothetical protein